jgi:tetratricopeptide (TPR) repeat protein
MVYSCCDGFISCTNILSNTAQVLTSLVEAITEDRSGSASNEDGLRLLEEAIELFQRCLTLQEFHYAESQAQEEEAALNSQPSDIEIPELEVPTSTTTSSHVTAPSASPFEGGSSSTTELVEEERWATIVEPVTNDTLLDTVLAQLETLTLLCEIITTDQGRGLAWIEEYSTNLLTTKLPAYLPSTDRDEEAALTRANFISALANANFRCQRMDAPTYQRALEDAYSSLDLAHDPEGLCDKAEAFLAYSNALGIFAPDPESAASSRWTVLSAALDALTAVSKLPTAQNVAAIHLLRGDVELLRYQLGQAPSSFPAAIRSAGTLLKNAGTYYRGAEREAMAILTREEDDLDERKEAVVKGALAEALGGERDRLRELVDGGRGAKGDLEKAAEAQRLLEEAVAGGLVGIVGLVREGIVRG